MNQERFTDRRRYPRFPTKLSLEYWETDDACHGGLVGNLSETGLLIYSIHDIPVGTEFTIKVFFFDGHDLDSFRVFAKTVWKDSLSVRDCSGCKYGLVFIRISEEDHRKLVILLSSPLRLMAF